MATRGQTGPSMPVHTTFNELIGDTLSASPVAVPLYQESREVFGLLVQNSSTTQVTAILGNPFAQWIELAPGESLPLDAHDPHYIHVRTNGGSATINWIGFLRDS